MTKQKKSLVGTLLGWLVEHTLGKLLQYAMLLTFVVLVVAATADAITARIFPIKVVGVEFGAPTHFIRDAAGLVLEVLGTIIGGFILQLWPLFLVLFLGWLTWQILKFRPEGDDSPTVWTRISQGLARGSYRGGRKIVQEGPKVIPQLRESAKERTLRVLEAKAAERGILTRGVKSVVARKRRKSFEEAIVYLQEKLSEVPAQESQALYIRVGGKKFRIGRK